MTQSLYLIYLNLSVMIMVVREEIDLGLLEDSVFATHVYTIVFGRVVLISTRGHHHLRHTRECAIRPYGPICVGLLSDYYWHRNRPPVKENDLTVPKTEPFHPQH